MIMSSISRSCFRYWNFRNFLQNHETLNLNYVPVRNINRCQYKSCGRQIIARYWYLVLSSSDDDSGAIRTARSIIDEARTVRPSVRQCAPWPLTARSRYRTVHWLPRSDHLWIVTYRHGFYLSAPELAGKYCFDCRSVLKLPEIFRW